jgi:hypothetical protein
MKQSLLAGLFALVTTFVSISIAGFAPAMADTTVFEGDDKLLLPGQWEEKASSQFRWTGGDVEAYRFASGGVVAYVLRGEPAAMGGEPADVFLKKLFEGTMAAFAKDDRGRRLPWYVKRETTHDSGGQTVMAGNYLVIINTNAERDVSVALFLNTDGWRSVFLGGSDSSPTKPLLEEILRRNDMGRDGEELSLR